MPGPTQGPKKRIVLPTLTGERQKDDNPFMKQTQTGSSGSFMSNPLTARGPFGSGGMAPANTLPSFARGSMVPNSQLGAGAGMGAYPVGMAGGAMGAGAPLGMAAGAVGAPNGGMSTAGFNSLFSMQNPFLSTLGGVAGAGVNLARGGNMPFAGAGTGAGGTGTGGLHPEEMRWKSLADKYGVNWDVTKSVYMRSPRNPSFSPAVALNLQLDDKAFGDAARQFGILTGDPDYDANVWRDWYNSGGDINRSPLAGHNYAVMQYEANQKAIENMVNGTPAPPSWL